MTDLYQHQELNEEGGNDGNNLDFNITMEEQNSAHKPVMAIDSTSTSGSATSGYRTSSNQQSSQGVKIPIDALPDYSKTIKKNGTEASYLSQAAHPGMCIMTVIFKAIAIITFLLTVFILSWLSSNKTFPFVIIVLSAAFDFWVVKNLSGRYLVKLRWWSEIQDNGEEKWRFEGFEDGVAPNAIDSSFFWISQFSALVFWAVVAFLTLIGFSFFYLTLSLVNLVFIFGNFMGYYKCRGEHQKKMKNAISMLGMKMISDAF